MNHDPEIYGEDPEQFRPGRFLSPDGTAVRPHVPDTKEEDQVAYGFGRR